MCKGYRVCCVSKPVLFFLRSGSLLLLFISRIYFEMRNIRIDFDLEDEHCMVYGNGAAFMRVMCM